MRSKKHNWPLTVFIGSLLGAVSFAVYRKMTLPEIADPWAGPMARQATTTPMQGLGSIGCGCTSPMHGAGRYAFAG
jgi:hypothetical protein